MSTSWARTAPGLMLVPSELLADRRFRMASFAQRGALLTLFFEQWCGGPLPADQVRLAALLAVPVESLPELLTESITSFFEPIETSIGCQLACPQIEAYRQRVLAIRHAQSEGGKRSTSRYNTDKRKRRKSSAGAAYKAASDLQVGEPEPERELGQDFNEPKALLGKPKASPAREAESVEDRARRYREAKG